MGRKGGRFSSTGEKKEGGGIWRAKEGGPAVPTLGPKVGGKKGEKKRRDREGGEVRDLRFVMKKE